MAPRISIQGRPTANAVSWLDLARRTEAAGFDALYVPDHPGTVASPFVALAAAAAVTDRIELGTCVANAGVWEPMRLADEAATLHAMSGGRALLGVGAGHTPAEWTATGRTQPPPRERVDRLIELVDTTGGLLAGGPVNHRGAHFTLVDAVIAEPPGARGEDVPVMVGGNGARVLEYGGRVADRVGLSGLGRTLADGHQHEVAWRPADLDRTIECVRGAADAAGRSPELEALVQVVEITDDGEARAAELAGQIEGGVSAEDLLAAPYVWIGTEAEIAERIDGHRRSHGIDRYVVRAAAFDDVKRILATFDP